MPEAAVVTLTNAIKLRPSDGELRKDRARAYIMLKKWDEAGEDLDAAARAVSPATARRMRLRALALLKIERLQDAWDDVEIALKLSPRDVDAVVLRGDIREAMRKKGMIDPVDVDQPEVRSPVVVGNQ